jgi:predicted amidophosphoribosyltransferase
MEVEGMKMPLVTQRDRCPDCGAQVPGGRAGCQMLWDEIASQAYQELERASVHNLAFDSYCMQHPETYCRSAKSYAAHLTRLCCGLEYDGDPVIYAAIQKWLNGNVPLEKPEVLSSRGTLTITHVRTARDSQEYRERVRAWAEDVWAAYATQHDLAGTWLKAAIER